MKKILKTEADCKLLVDRSKKKKIPEITQVVSVREDEPLVDW